MMQLISYFLATRQRAGQGLRVDTDANGQLSHCGVDLPDPRASARRLAAMDGHGNTSGGQSAEVDCFLFGPNGTYILRNVRLKE